MVDPGFTKGGGHKLMDLLSITKTSKWEVVKNSASPKDLLGGGGGDFVAFFPHFKSISSPNRKQTYLFIHFLATHFSISSFP